MTLPSINNRALYSRRVGVSTIELVVASSMLIVVMTFATTMIYKIQSVVKETRFERIAVNELSNQLERLTVMELDQAVSAIESLAASDDCKSVLTNPELSGAVVEDSLGHRIDLEIGWQTVNVRKPIRLSGWLVDATQETKDE